MTRKPAGFTGDGGPAIHAEIRNPLGVAVDGAGNLLISDTYNQRIRVVAESSGTFYGQTMTAGHLHPGRQRHPAFAGSSAKAGPCGDPPHGPATQTGPQSSIDPGVPGPPATPG